MSPRGSFASIPLAWALAVGFLSVALAVNAAAAPAPFLNAGKTARHNVIEIKDRGRGPRIGLPIAPSYLYYDYPYYYSRGYYPTHVGPGFVYYGYYYYRYRSFRYSRYAGRCSRRHQRCATNWHSDLGPGANRSRAHRSFGACRCL